VRHALTVEQPRVGDASCNKSKAPQPPPRWALFTHRQLGVKANLAAKGDNKSIPAVDGWKLSPDAKFVHYCDNETIGVRWG
jgi:hypothetical protein